MDLEFGNWGGRDRNGNMACVGDQTGWGTCMKDLKVSAKWA
jgi:hypothetical protein